MNRVQLGRILHMREGQPTSKMNDNGESQISAKKGQKSENKGAQWPVQEDSMKI